MGAATRYLRRFRHDELPDLHYRHPLPARCCAVLVSRSFFWEFSRRSSLFAFRDQQCGAEARHWREDGNLSSHGKKGVSRANRSQRRVFEEKNLITSAATAPVAACFLLCKR